MLERPQDRFQRVLSSIVRDAMKVAIGTWPTPESPQRQAAALARWALVCDMRLKAF